MHCIESVKTKAFIGISGSVIAGNMSSSNREEHGMTIVVFYEQRTFCRAGERIHSLIYYSLLLCYNHTNTESHPNPILTHVIYLPYLPRPPQALVGQEADLIKLLKTPNGFSLTPLLTDIPPVCNFNPPIKFDNPSSSNTPTLELETFGLEL